MNTTTRKGYGMISLGSWLFIKNCTKADTKRDEGLTTPADIERFDDIQYGENAKWQIMDVYRPKSIGDMKLPVIVSSHGGGWVYGNKEVYQFYCMNLAQRGFVVVNYTYRLAPKFKYPAAIEDTNSVYTWIMKNGNDYGMDTNNIFAVGDSAGAQIVGLYSSILTNKEYAKKYAFTIPENLKLNAVGLNCGKYKCDGDKAEGFFKDLLPNRGSLEELKMISVVEHITAEFPPSFIFTANKDFLINEPASLIEKLEQNNVEYESKLYGTEDNPLYHVFHCNVRSEDAKTANDDEVEFFKKHIIEA